MIKTKASCESCLEEGEEESSKRFLLQYPEFARLRLKHHGRHIFGEASDYISRLKNFITEPKRFVVS